MSEYFCGWYFKCQSGDGTLAVIPSFHRTGKESFCAVQVITGEGAFYVKLPYGLFRGGKRSVAIGENIFSVKGMRLKLHTPELHVEGALRFGPLTPIRYDIMGPFHLVPFMECRHSIYSMKHTVNGRFTVNGKKYLFSDGIGYLEGDRGRSFPVEYMWTQCSFPNGSLMLSAAQIPLGPFRFTGIIGVVWWRGKEYRVATYLGAKAVKIYGEEVIVRQKDCTFTVKLLKKNSLPLRAPDGGAMSRTVRESAACRVYYRFEKKGRTLFAFEDDSASFEYEYSR